MFQVKAFFQRKLDKIIEDPELKDNMDLDQNKIMTIIITKYLFETTKLVIVIFQVSYYLGILFYIYCEIIADILNSEEQGTMSDEEWAKVPDKEKTPDFIS
jgi:hypothetical protein